MSDGAAVAAPSGARWEELNRALEASFDGPDSLQRALRCSFRDAEAEGAALADLTAAASAVTAGPEGVESAESELRAGDLLLRDMCANSGEAFNYNVSLLGPDTSAALSADPPPSAASLRSLRAQRRRDLERATREARQLLAQWHGDDRWRSQGGESEGSSDAALIESAQALREALPEAVDAAGVEEAASALAEAAGEAQESAHTFAAAFDDQLLAWTDVTDPPLVGIGPKAAEVQQLWKRAEEMLGAALGRSLDTEEEVSAAVAAVREEDDAQLGRSASRLQALVETVADVRTRRRALREALSPE